LAVLTIVAIGAIIRGTWADTNAKNPTSSAEGSLIQLYRTPDGRKVVRCARVLDYPAEAVWAVVTDYNHFGDIFPHERAVRGERDPDGRYHVTGLAHAWPYGEWPFDVHVTHQEMPQSYVASWDDPGGDLTVNRGSWTVTRLGPDRTLLVFELEMEVRPFPVFFVRNVQLDRLKAMTEAVNTRLKTQPARQP
jgi:hypothetical protein